ncbi:MAG TPA: hypothetical protein VE715_06930 [Blastocatellia bacterium]|nr:hypothetical protein [Blastocatellia bacterium]
MKQRFLIVILTVTMIPLIANAQHANKPPRSGALTGVINRTESDMNGLYSVWIRVNGKMYEFRIEKARVTGGSKSDLLREGISVRINYRGLEHSEMDDFYTAEAVTITIRNNKPTEAPRNNEKR